MFPEVTVEGDNACCSVAQRVACANKTLGGWEGVQGNELTC